MVPFLKLFGVEDGNGLSPFIKTFNSQEHMSMVLQQFFGPPKVDTRGRLRNQVVESTCDLDDIEAEEDNVSSIETGIKDVISQFANEINKLDCDEDLGDFVLDDDDVELESVKSDTESCNLQSANNS